MLRIGAKIAPILAVLAKFLENDIPQLAFMGDVKWVWIAIGGAIISILF